MLNFLTNLSLWKKITILTTFGLALGVAVFSTVGMRAVNEATEAMLQDRLTTAHLVAGYVDEVLVLALNELEDSARNIETSGLNTDMVSLMASMQEQYSNLSISIRDIYLIDENGLIIYCQTDVPGQKNLNLSLFSDVAQSMEKNRPIISRTLPSPETNNPVIFLASPVNFPQSALKHALAVSVDLAQSRIGVFIRPLRLGQTGYVEIVDQSGIVIARTDPGPKLEPFEESDHSGHFTALINAGEPTRGICHTCHEPQQKVKGRDVLAFVPLSAANWGVVVRQSETEALAPAYELRQNLIFYGLGLVSVALLFVVITTRNVGSRIQILTAASRRIANGDLTGQVGALGRDEVGILAQTFDDMRSKLKTSYGNLEQRTRELIALLSVSEILVSTLDLPTLLNSVVNKAMEIISNADGGVLLLENDTGRIAVQCAVGLDKDAIFQAEHTVSNSQIYLLPESQHVEPEERMRTVTAALLEIPLLRSRVKSYTNVRVIHQNRWIGNLILVSFRRDQAFTDSDKRLLQAVADDISIAIERAELTKKADEARALHEADRLRSQFISSVSHELRTPLTIIKGYATSLLRQNVNWDKETQLEFLNNIDSKTDELRDLIDKILQSAKLEAGALRLEKEPVLIPRITRKVIEENYPHVRKHRFTSNFPQPFPVVEADSRCIEQVMRNLLENAVKYSPQGGEIVITGEIKDGQVIVSVADQGMGIPLQFQDKIFERFFRVDSKYTGSIIGSGLGLSICKGHIKAHGGKIWFESTHGKGSKFYFSLPFPGLEDIEDLDGWEEDDKENSNSLSR